MVHYPLLLLLALSTIFHLSAEGATTVAPPLSATAKEFLDSHNKARGEVGVPPLSWSQQLATTTSRLVRHQRDSMACQFANLTAVRYGANQLWAGGGTFTPTMAVEEWVKQKQFYNHANNSCVPNHTCGVYTQVVWRKSVSLGCAQATCVKDMASLTICFYDPPGNYVGESPY